LASVVADAQVVLSLKRDFARRPAKPLHRLHFILRHALAIAVTDTQIVLGNGIPFSALALVPLKVFVSSLAQSGMISLEAFVPLEDTDC